MRLYNTHNTSVIVLEQSSIPALARRVMYDIETGPANCTPRYEFSLSNWLVIMGGNVRHKIVWGTTLKAVQ